MYEAMTPTVRRILLNYELYLSWHSTANPMECLGSGAFGGAYRLSDGRVLKISRTMDSTVLWIREAARRMAAGEKLALGMPKVYHFETHGKGWWAVMEYIPSHVSTGGWERLDTAHPGVALAIECMYQTWEFTAFHGGDMHAGNWGYAEDGRVVCFDPDSSDATIPPTKIGLKGKRLHGCGRGRWAQ